MRVRVAIVGAGFAGLGAALRLRAEGEDSYVVIERAPAVGGTWRDNTYPGVACDVPAHLYCFSFLPNPWFSRRFAPGAEIRAYLEHAADPIRDHLRLSTNVDAATWVDNQWELTTSAGPVSADVLVLAAGRLTAPRIPDVPGRFEGPIFHSSRWDHSVALDGRRVAVVGTGASGIQLLPAVTRRARSVVVMQRSAPYILPRDDAPYTSRARTRFAKHPDELADLRADLFARAEMLYDARVGDLEARHNARWQALQHLADHVPDPSLRTRLTPDYEFGCKRVLYSSQYYLAAAAPHVTVTGSLAGFDPEAVLTDSGRYEADVVILATGFHTARQPYARFVRGRTQRTLDEVRRYAGIRLDLRARLSQPVRPGRPERKPQPQLRRGHDRDADRVPPRGPAPHCTWHDPRDIGPCRGRVCARDGRSQPRQAVDERLLQLVRRSPQRTTGPALAGSRHGVPRPVRCLRPPSLR
jgi:cation diffusion facilitator CzcD-associated flavoprotein CzcO